jgi:hypothetical protein
MSALRRACNPSLHSYHVSLVQWTTCLLPVMRDQIQSPGRYLQYVKPGSHVSIVSLHWWPRSDWSLWPHLRQALSRTITRPSYRQCDDSTWSHTALLWPALLCWFHTCCRSSFRLHNWHCGLLGGGALWRACSLTAIIPCLTGPVDYPFASCHEGPRFNTSCETGILLLTLSHYSMSICLYFIYLYIYLFIYAAVSSRKTENRSSDDFP